MRHPRAQNHATALRKQLTPAERLLWSKLRQRQLDRFKFRRQYPIGPYIADFACIEATLIVEVDGGQHLESQRDTARDEYLRNRGFNVLRFWNNQVFQEPEAVLAVILDALARPHPVLPP